MTAPLPRPLTWAHTRRTTVLAVRARPLPGLLRRLDRHQPAPGGGRRPRSPPSSSAPARRRRPRASAAADAADAPLPPSLRRAACRPRRRLACRSPCSAPAAERRRLARAARRRRRRARRCVERRPTRAPSAGTRAVVRAAEPGAEERCRPCAAGRVRLPEGRGPAADLAFVRCLNVLMAGDGRPAVAATDPRLIAIAGERAAWNDRPPESWEHVMPYGVRDRRAAAAGRRRLPASGSLCPGGRGAAAVLRGAWGAGRDRRGRRGLAIIGGGKIGEALLSGLVRRGGPDGLVVCERSPERAAELADRYGVAGRRPRRRRRSGPGCCSWRSSRRTSAPCWAAGRVRRRRPGTCVVSVAAGIPTARIEAALPDGTPVVRVMPNTPALVDEGMSVLSRRRARRGRSTWTRRRRCSRPVGRVRRVPETAAGRRHGAVRQRAGLLLLPRRGDGRRRHPARACRGRWPPTSSCRRRWARP